MNTNMQGHNHSGKSHLLWMLGLGGAIFIVLLGTGRSVGQALPLALFLACPLMMIGMMFMMRGGNGNQHGNDDTTQPDHNATADHRNQDSAEPWQDSPNMTSPQSPQSPQSPESPQSTNWP